MKEKYELKTDYIQNSNINKNYKIKPTTNPKNYSNSSRKQPKY